MTGNMEPFVERLNRARKLYLLPGKDIMGSYRSKKYRVFQEFESEAIIHGYRTFPSIFYALDSFDPERRMRSII